jgi:hypothetical protein
MKNRRSTLPTKRVKLSSSYFCVGCRKPVNPNLCRTGRVLQGINWTAKTEVTLAAVTPKVVYAVEEKRIPVVKYNRGLICDTCSANYHHSAGHPIVITDPLAVIGQTLSTNKDGF